MLLALLPPLALVRREMVDTLRRGRSFAFVGLLLVVVSLIVALMWPDIWMNAPGMIAMYSRLMVQLLFVALLGGMCLFVPALAGTAIVGEREKQTLEALLLTTLSPGAILLAKLVNALLLYTLVILCMLPVFGTVMFLVGLSVGELVEQMISLYLTTLACASVGLFCSAFFRRTIVALILSYVGMLLVCGGVAVLLAVLASLLSWSETLEDIYQLYTSYLAQLYPPLKRALDEPAVLLIGLFTPARVVSVRVLPIPFPVWVSAVFPILVSVVSLLFAWRALRRKMPVNRHEQQKVIDDVSQLQARRRHFPFYLVDPLKRRKPIEDGRNPVLLRELRWGLLGRLTFLIRLFNVALVLDILVIALSIVLAFGGQGYGPVIFAALGLVSVVCAFTTVIIANMVAKEEEQGNLDMLRVTLLWPREILFGKLRAGITAITPFLLATAGITLLAGVLSATCLAEKSAIPLAVQATVMLVVCTLMSAGLALYASTRTKHTSSAVVMGFALTFLFLVGLPFIPYSAGAAIEFCQTGRVLETAYPTDDALLTAMSPFIAFARQYLDYRQTDSYGAWAASMALCGVVSLLSCMLSVHRFAVRRMRER